MHPLIEMLPTDGKKKSLTKQTSNAGGGIQDSAHALLAALYD